MAAHAACGGERRRDPAQATHGERAGAGRLADLPLEALGTGAGAAEQVGVLGVARLPCGESGGERLELLPGPLVRVGDDALLSARDAAPASIPLRIEEPGDRVRGDRAGEL